MAVKLEQATKRYIGLSSDIKPLPGMVLDGYTVLATDMLPGSSFLEADTKKIYRWTGSEWALTSGDVVSASTGATAESELLQGLVVSNLAVLDELKKIRLTLA